jgi:hypothetical protein
MAKTTTKKTGAKPVDDARAGRARLDEEIRKLEDAQAGRAVKRAIRWAQLLDQLEGLLDHADTLFTKGVPVDLEHVGREHARLTALGHDVTFGDVQAQETIADEYFLMQDLQLAENWLPMIGSEYRSGHSHALADVRLRLDGAKPVDPISTPAESLATAIVCVRMLLEVDLARAKTFDRAPHKDDLDVLRRLRDTQKTAKEIAVEIAGKGKQYAAEEKRVERAIERLRDVHGFELLNRRGSGYSLSKTDRRRLDELDRGT